MMYSEYFHKMDMLNIHPILIMKKKAHFDENNFIGRRVWECGLMRWRWC
jgi:hypothetical protein